MDQEQKRKETRTKRKEISQDRNRKETTNGRQEIFILSTGWDSPRDKRKERATPCRYAG